MTPENLKTIIESHAAWLQDGSGQCADLSGVDLRSADLRNVDLTGANLTGADLKYANLSRANLTRANLTDANLYNADLRGANLTHADFRGAFLSGVNLQSSKGLRYASVSWSGHGEKGRQLLCAVIAGEARYFCGCFLQGTADELQAWIEEDLSWKGVMQSRRKSLWIVSDLISWEWGWEWG